MPQVAWDPWNLPLCTEEAISTQTKLILSLLLNSTHWKDLSKKYGINGPSIPAEILSIWMMWSFLHDWMHLFLENHCKSLILLWAGKFKSLDEGTVKSHMQLLHISGRPSDRRQPELAIQSHLCLGNVTTHSQPLCTDVPHPCTDLFSDP